MPAVPPPPPPAPPRKQKIQGLVCPSCGGSLEIEEGLTTAVCSYCETGLAVVGRRGTRRMMVLDRISRDRASEELTRWFRKGVRKEPALKRKARIEEAFLAWFPFIRARCDVVGWVLGINERREKRGNRWVTVREPVERRVSQPVDHTLAAADMSEFGVGRIDLSGDTVLPLDEEKLKSRGMIFRPNRAEEETADAVVDEAVRKITTGSRPDKTSFSWFSVVRRKTDLVFYPLWVIRYSFRDRTYQVLIDAEDGSLAYGKAPGNNAWRAFSLVASCAGASFLGTTLLQHLGGLLRSDNGLAALGIVSVALGAVVLWGFRQFRSGGVVEEGTGITDDPAATPALDAITDLTKGL